MLTTVTVEPYYKDHNFNIYLIHLFFKHVVPAEGVNMSLGLSMAMDPSSSKLVVSYSGISLKR